MKKWGASKLVHFSTDMVYGYPRSIPISEQHRTSPIGDYGKSKLAGEELCQKYRHTGMGITIFRPRLIIGPGRVGILSKLFNLVDRNLPVPMIGPGRNAYQFVSVFDCVSAARSAWQARCPNETYNLGSTNPPEVRNLLQSLVKEARSTSIVLPTPASMVKGVLAALDYLDMPVMDPEQYSIADKHFVLDISKAQRELDWHPTHRDDDMLIAAYRDYRRRMAKDGIGV
jgi:dTDP-glucose 4,6-dehydratase